MKQLTISRTGMISVFHRKDQIMTGLIRSFSTQFEFVNRSYELLKEEFEQHYLSAKAAIVFYLRNNSWNWDKIFHCTLDFGTYSGRRYGCLYQCG